MKKLILSFTACMITFSCVYGQPGTDRKLTTTGFVFVPPATPYSTEHVKNYCTEVIPSPNANDYSVMAGTGWYQTYMPRWKVAHFMMVDADGLPAGASQTNYRDDNYVDFRVKDIALDGFNSNDQSFITELVTPAHRDYPLPDGTTHTIIPTVHGFTDRDGIKVLRVKNDDGSIQDEITIFETSPLPPTQTRGNSFFPINSMYHDEKLYICGFYTPTGPSGDVIEGEPYDPTVSYETLTSTHAKYAFILSIDVSGPVMTFNSSDIMFFDYVPTNNLYGHDFDIAVRMKVLMDGNIMITGSVNEQSGTHNPGFVRSGTMAIIVDPGLTTVIGDASFIRPGNADGFGGNEYGVDVIQKSAGDIYVVGNGFQQADYYDSDGFGFDPKPDRLIVSRVRNIGGVYGFGINRFESEESPRWFLNAVASENPTNANFYRFTVAGLSATSCGNQANPSSYGNINPFMLDFQIDLPMVDIQNPRTTLLNEAQLSLIETGTSTGDYDTRGGAKSNIYFNPTFAARDDNNSLVVISAPKLDIGYNSLGLKMAHLSYDNHSSPSYMHPNPVNQLYSQGTGSGPNTPAGPLGPMVDPPVFNECGNASCEVQFNKEFSTTNNITMSQPVLNVMAYREGSAVAYNDFFHHSIGACNNPNSWKMPSSINEEVILDENDIAIYPNPTDNVAILFAKTELWSRITSIEVTDITGRLIKVIEAEQVNEKLQMNTSSWASGTYLVKVNLKNNTSINKKLVINK